MSDSLDRLTSIKSFPSLVEYLRDELDWPVETDDVEDLTFEYEPEELGLDARSAVKVREIKQLRPLAAGQPWGVFFVGFEPKRLPVVVLRRILRALVLKKRATAARPRSAAWRLNDLLFVSSYGESDERQLTFAHFSEGAGAGGPPTLKVLGWNARHTTLRLEDTRETLKDKLRWPRDESDVDAWRERWSSAFRLGHRETVRTSKDLAVKLARLAEEIRGRAREVLAVESERGELRKLYGAFRAALIQDLTEDDFADTYAQTIAYGLLSASISKRDGARAADGLKELVPNTNPFLKELMKTFLTVGGREGRMDFDELGVGEVVELLGRTRMDEVLKDFGARNPSEDPVIHFYELFLKEYDPERRMKRGVFYTPRPVVNFIVRSVDEILRAEFGLEDGLADTTTWGEFVEREKIRNPKSEIRVPASVGPEEPFVQILDPATGTGTFLVEVVERIHATVRAKWARRGKSESEIRELWNEYVPRHLLPRLHGFELMMAPYAIAHMKLGLKLTETKYRFDSAERARVYLTNTLDEPKDFSGYFEQMSPALAHEADAANRVKRRAHVTVVLGNPPYSNISQNMGEWIKSLVEDYRLVEGVRIVEKSKRNHLQDDYVKFIRVAHEYVTAAGCGVVGYITNHSYLDSPTFRGMRYSLLSDFDGVRVVNLHGNAKRDQQGLRAGDENVFDIQQGVAISCLSRAPDASGRMRATLYADLYGTRESKYDFLLTKNIKDLDAPLSPKAPFFFLVPAAASGARAEYEAGWKIDDLMPFGGAGIKTNRDAFVIDFEDEPLRERMRVFADERVSDSEAESALGLKENYVWKIPKARASFRRDTNSDCIRDVAYRPFDVRRIYYQKDVVFNPRFDTMRQSGRGNLYLLTCRQQYSEGFRHVSVCREMFECCVVSAKSREITSGFPLYVYTPAAEGGQLSLAPAHERAANYSAEFLSALKRTTSLQLVPDGRGDLHRTFGPEDVFHYVYAVLHSPSYRARYAEFLKVDFPRVPLTPDAGLFRGLCALGADLVALHLQEDEYEAASWNASRPRCESPLKKHAALFVGKTGAEVAKGYPVHRDESVYVNSSGRFEGVTREVWGFQVGGYKVCEKWLKDRRGRTLSDEDVEHYGRIVAALGETVRLMSEVDSAVEARGGWPLGEKRETPGS
jgi:hypothetical protein